MIGFCFGFATCAVLCVIYKFRETLVPEIKRLFGK